MEQLPELWMNYMPEESFGGIAIPSQEFRESGISTNYWAKYPEDPKKIRFALKIAAFRHHVNMGIYYVAGVDLIDGSVIIKKDEISIKADRSAAIAHTRMKKHKSNDSSNN